MKSPRLQMVRIVVVYGAVLAAGSLGLQWLQYKLLIRAHPVGVWLGLLAVAFMALGIRVGTRLFRRQSPTPFEPNVRARQTLGIIRHPSPDHRSVKQ